MKTRSKLILSALSLLTFTGCSEEAAAGILAGSVLIYLIGSVFMIGLVIYALFDLYNRSGEVTNRLLWTIVILIVPFIGAIAYFLIGRAKGPSGDNTNLRY